MVVYVQPAQTSQASHALPLQISAAPGQKELPQPTPQAPIWQVWPVGQLSELPTHTPAVQTSSVVHGSPSSQRVPSAIAWQTPDVVLQV
jgi:hypothetical protein